MADSATQSGVQDENLDPNATPPETKDQEPSAREIAMQQIADRSDEQRVAEITGAPAPATSAAAPPADGATPPVADQVAAQLAEDVIIDEAELARFKVRTKIDGKEAVVPVADMRRDYQKNAAADKRLDEASRLLREAREEAQALKAAPPVRDGAAPPAEQNTNQPSEDVKAARKELVSALFEGDEEKALSAFDKVIAQGRPEPTPAVDQNQLVAQLTPVIEQQLVVKSALEKFSKDHPDIVSDPHLDKMTAEFIEQEIKEGKSFVEALEPAVKKTRDWLASKGAVAPKTTTPTMDRTTRLERKEGIDVIPALNTKATTVDEPEMSASHVIAEMRKARGMTV